jgi:hypothetical protein
VPLLQVPALKKHLEATLQKPEEFLSGSRPHSTPKQAASDGPKAQGRSLRDAESEKPSVETEDD